MLLRCICETFLKALPPVLFRKNTWYIYNENGVKNWVIVLILI